MLASLVALVVSGEQADRRGPAVPFLAGSSSSPPASSSPGWPLDAGGARRPGPPGRGRGRAGQRGLRRHRPGVADGGTASPVRAPVHGVGGAEPGGTAGRVGSRCNSAGAGSSSVSSRWSRAAPPRRPATRRPRPAVALRAPGHDRWRERARRPSPRPAGRSRCGWPSGAGSCSPGCRPAPPRGRWAFLVPGFALAGPALVRLLPGRHTAGEARHPRGGAARLCVNIAFFGCDTFVPLAATRSTAPRRSWPGR